MKEETSDELLVGQRHIDGITGAIVFGREDSMRVRDGSDAGIGDGDTVGITAEVVYGIAKAVESLFDEGAPVFEI